MHGNKCKKKRHIYQNIKQVIIYSEVDSVAVISEKMPEILPYLPYQLYPVGEQMSWITLAESTNVAGKNVIFCQFNKNDNDLRFASTRGYKTDAYFSCFQELIFRYIYLLRDLGVIVRNNFHWDEHAGKSAIRTNQFQV